MTATISDAIIANARSVPDAIARAKVLDPPLADALTTKALIQSKTVWGTLIALILAEGVRRLNLGWSQDIIALLSGLLVMAATLALRWITAGRVTSVLPPAPAEDKPATPPAAS